MGPRMGQLVESHVEELHAQAAHQRPIHRVLRRGHDGATFERVKSRLGSYLVEVGQRLQATTTRSPVT